MGDYNTDPVYGYADPSFEPNFAELFGDDFVVDPAFLDMAEIDPNQEPVADPALPAQDPSFDAAPHNHELNGASQPERSLEEIEADLMRMFTGLDAINELPSTTDSNPAGPPRASTQAEIADVTAPTMEPPRQGVELTQAPIPNAPVMMAAAAKPAVEAPRSTVATPAKPAVQVPVYPMAAMPAMPMPAMPGLIDLTGSSSDEEDTSEFRPGGRPPTMSQMRARQLRLRRARKEREEREALNLPDNQPTPLSIFTYPSPPTTQPVVQPSKQQGRNLAQLSPPTPQSVAQQPKQQVHALAYPTPPQLYQGGVQHPSPPMDISDILNKEDQSPILSGQRRAPQLAQQQPEQLGQQPQQFAQQHAPQFGQQQSQFANHLRQSAQHNPYMQCGPLISDKAAASGHHYVGLDADAIHALFLALTHRHVFLQDGTMALARGYWPCEAAADNVAPPASDARFPNDVTSYNPYQYGLSKQSAGHLPLTIAWIEEPRGMVFPNPGCLVPSPMREGQDGKGPIMYDINGNVLRDLKLLPRQISSAVEGWRMHYWMTLDKRIKWSDIIGRMPHQCNAQGGTGPLADGLEYVVNVLKERVRQFRRDAGILEPLTTLFDHETYQVTEHDVAVVSKLSQDQLLYGTWWTVDLDRGVMHQPQSLDHSVPLQKTLYVLPEKGGTSLRVKCILRHIKQQQNPQQTQNLQQAQNFQQMQNPQQTQNPQQVRNFQQMQSSNPMHHPLQMENPNQMQTAQQMQNVQPHRNRSNRQNIPNVPNGQQYQFGQPRNIGQSLLNGQPMQNMQPMQHMQPMQNGQYMQNAHLMHNSTNFQGAQNIQTGQKNPKKRGADDSPGDNSPKRMRNNFKPSPSHSPDQMMTPDSAIASQAPINALPAAMQSFGANRQFEAFQKHQRKASQ